MKAVCVSLTGPWRWFDWDGEDAVTRARAHSSVLKDAGVAHVLNIIRKDSAHVMEFTCESSWDTLRNDAHAAGADLTAIEMSRKRNAAALRVTPLDDVRPASFEVYLPLPAVGTPESVGAVLLYATGWLRGTASRTKDIPQLLALHQYADKFDRWQVIRATTLTVPLINYDRS